MEVLGNCGTGRESEWVGNGRMSRRMRGGEEENGDLAWGVELC